MPLTLQRYRLHALVHAIGLLILVGAVITACVNKSGSLGEYIWVLVIIVVVFLPLIGYNLFKFFSLRRRFSDAEPIRGTVVGLKHGIWKNSARLILSDGEREYRTPAIFTRFQASTWLDGDVEFALGRDGYVFVFRIIS